MKGFYPTPAQKRVIDLMREQDRPLIRTSYPHGGRVYRVGDETIKPNTARCLLRGLVAGEETIAARGVRTCAYTLPEWARTPVAPRRYDPARHLSVEQIAGMIRSFLAGDRPGGMLIEPAREEGGYGIWDTVYVPWAEVEAEVVAFAQWYADQLRGAPDVSPG